VGAVAKTVRSIGLMPARAVLMFDRLILFAIIKIHNRDQGFPPSRDRTRIRGCTQGEGEWQHPILHGRRVEGLVGQEAWFRAYP